MNIEKKHFDAAGAMVDLIAARLGKGRAVHSETAIAAAARMSGMMLFRTFGFDTTKMPAGAAVLSEEANERGPQLLNIVASMLQKYELQPDQDKLAKVNERGEPPKLTVLETQDLLEDDLNEIRKKFALSLEDGAHAGALAVAFIIKECTPTIGLEVGFNAAAFGFIEGCKTVPRSGGIQPTDAAKRPWYKPWK